MRALLIICLLTLSLFSKSQKVDETKTFLNKIRKSVFKVDTLFYTEDLNELTLSDIRKELLRDTIWIVQDLHLPNGKLKKIDSIIFTQEEKAYIQSQLKSQEGVIWDDNLLENSKLIARDTIFKLYRFSSNYREYEPKTIYSFSKPIFIRDNSICFFYYQYLTGGRGEGELGIYKKFNDEWKYIQWIYAWGGGGN